MKAVGHDLVDELARKGKGIIEFIGTGGIREKDFENAIRLFLQPVCIVSLDSIDESSFKNESFGDDARGNPLIG